MLFSVQAGLQTLRANPVRTSLSTLGIVMGAASLVGVLSLGDGAEAFARQQIERNGLQVIGISPKTSDLVDGLTVPRSSFPIFTVDQATTLAKMLMPGSAVMLRVEGTGTFVTGTGGPSRAALVTGALGAPSAAGLVIAHGRFLSDHEMSGGAAAVVVSNRLATELARPRDPGAILGATLTLQGQSWSIVGVLATYPGERLFGAIVPFAAASRATVPSTSPRPHTLLVKAPRIEDVTTVRRQVDTWADSADPRWRAQSEITIATTGLDRLQQLNQGIRLFKILMGAVTAISLVVGGIGIMNVLLASVMERTREIGVRKATGAKRRDIIAQFLAESVTISVAGSLLGAAVGIGAAFATTAVMRSQTGAPIQAAATWQTLLVSMGAAVTVGVIFGMYPALKAAYLSPVEAMRYE